MNANVGMMHPVFAPVSAYTPGTGITYGTGLVVAEAVSASLSWERSDGRFYGDDTQLDSDNGVLSYTIDFEPTGLTDAVREIYCHSYGETKVYNLVITADAFHTDGLTDKLQNVFRERLSAQLYIKSGGSENE